MDTDLFERVELYQSGIGDPEQYDTDVRALLAFAQSGADERYWLQEIAKIEIPPASGSWWSTERKSQYAHRLREAVALAKRGLTADHP